MKIREVLFESVLNDRKLLATTMRTYKELGGRIEGLSSQKDRDDHLVSQAPDQDPYDAYPKW